MRQFLIPLSRASHSEQEKMVKKKQLYKSAPHTSQGKMLENGQNTYLSSR